MTLVTHHSVFLLSSDRQTIKPEMVEVAALHMWNQKYGPQVIFDCKHKTINKDVINPPEPPEARSAAPHPHRIDRGGQQVSLLRLALLLLVGAVFLHGLPAGEVDDAPGSLLPLRRPRAVVHFPELHALEVLPLILRHEGSIRELHRLFVSVFFKQLRGFSALNVSHMRC